MTKLINALRIAEFNGYSEWFDLTVTKESKPGRNTLYPKPVIEILKEYTTLDGLYNLIQSICQEHIDCGIKIDISLSLHESIMDIQEQLIKFYESL